MSTVLVLAEHHEGTLVKASLNAIGAAQTLVEKVGGGFDIAVVGHQVAGVVSSLQGYGANTIYQVEDDSTGQISVGIYPTGAYTAATLQAKVRTLTAAGSGSIDCSGSDVTSGNFKLA